MNTKHRIVRIMERMTISTTTAKEAKRGATRKKEKEEEEEWYGEVEEADFPYQFTMTKEEEEETIARKQKGVI